MTIIEALVFGNDVPEISAVDVDQSTTVAPCEGKRPKSLLLDPDWDMKSHPLLDPTGENGLSHQRVTKMFDQPYF